MPELPRSRDCTILKKGDTFTVTVDETMAVNGWKGGQAVKWAPSTKDELLVTFSDGFYAGFLLWGSEEDGDLHTSMTRSQAYYRYATIGAGGWHISTSSYERYTYASRQSGPLVPITYHASDQLLFSLRGYWTNEDEWTLSGDSRAPNAYFVGFLTQVPSSVTNHHMGIQVGI